MTTRKDSASAAQEQGENAIPGILSYHFVSYHSDPESQVAKCKSSARFKSQNCAIILSVKTHIKHDPHGEVIETLRTSFENDPITAEMMPPEIAEEVKKHTHGAVMVARRFWHPYLWYDHPELQILGHMVEDDTLPRRVSWFAWNDKEAVEVISF